MASRPEFSPARCSSTVLSWVSKLGALGQCLPVAPCTPETSDLVRTTNWPLDEGKSKRVGGPRPNEETMSLSTPSSHPLCQFSPNPPTPSNNRIPRQCWRDVAAQTPMFSVSLHSPLVSRRHSNKHHGTGISFEEPNPTGSRPRDLIGLYKQHRIIISCTSRYDYINSPAV